MDCFKAIRKGLKRGHAFHYDGGTSPENLRRILYSMKDFVYVDRKTVGEYRKDPSDGNIERIIGRQNDEIRETIRILNSGKNEKEEIEAYLKTTGLVYDEVRDLNPYEVKTSLLVYEYVRKDYNLKEYRWYPIVSIYKKTEYSIGKFINQLLKKLLWPRVGMYSQHKKVAEYLRENPTGRFSHIDMANRFFGCASQKKFEKDMRSMDLILRELASPRIGMAICDGSGKYGYNPEGQIDFKEKTTPRFASVAPTLVALVAFISTLTYYFLYFLTNRDAILKSFTKILGH